MPFGPIWALANQGNCALAVEWAKGTPFAHVVGFSFGGPLQQRRGTSLRDTVPFSAIYQACAFLIVLSAGGFARAQNALLWGALEAGSHGIGYRTLFSVDESREYDGKRGRPILFRVWYPAASADGAKLSYGAYFEVPPLNSHPLLSHRLRSLARDVTCKDLFNRQSESLLRAPERKAFQRLLATPTAAALDACEAPGSFPVVLYHAGAGGSFEENSLLFEYLASAGYIV